MVFNKFSLIYRIILKNHFYHKRAVPIRLNLFGVLTIRTIMASNLLKPPREVEGLTVLNKALFEKNITVPCLVVSEVKISLVMPVVKKYLLKVENFKPIEINDRNETVIYLNPEIIKNWENISIDDRKSLERLSLKENNIEMRSFNLQYENFSVETVLRSVLPKSAEGLSSFTKIGHIVHINLREHLIPFKDIIAQVLFDKVAGCKTVVNKAAIIDNTYRNFQIEVLKGENNLLTQVKENKCIFEFDFSKVYWNSRLCTEHERIVKMIQTGDVLFDVFAGVGPFSLPIAKKRCYVFANDLNPESYKWLNHNSKKNKIDEKYFKSFNKDGREFILNEIKEFLPKYLNSNKIFIIMNLPAMAIEFLDAFIGLYKEEELQEFETPPIIIVYCFTKGENCKDLAKNLLFQSINCDINDKIIDIFRVRTVSSFKEMMRITFRLDRDILTGSVLKNRPLCKRKCAQVDCDIAPKKYHGEKQEENK